MKIFIVRHGETVWNKIEKTQGRTNNRLSNLGKQQAKNAGVKLKNENIDLIIASPLCRTIQTANLINEELKVKILKDERIIEIDQGIYSGKLKSELTEEQFKRKRLKLKEDGCENYLEVYNRCVEFLKFVKQKYSNKTVLVVTHKCVAEMLELYVKYGKFYENFYEFINQFNNAEFRKYEI